MRKAWSGVSAPWCPQRRSPIMPSRTHSNNLHVIQKWSALPWGSAVGLKVSTRYSEAIRSPVDGCVSYLVRIPKISYSFSVWWHIPTSSLFHSREFCSRLNRLFPNYMTNETTTAVSFFSVSVSATTTAVSCASVLLLCLLLRRDIHFPFDEICRRLLFFTLGRSVSEWIRIHYTTKWKRQARQHQGKRPTWSPVYVHSLVCLAHVQNDMPY